MQTKIKIQKNGAWTIFDKCGVYYLVKIYTPGGVLFDKMRCDTYRSALEYFRVFNATAKNNF